MKTNDLLLRCHQLLEQTGMQEFVTQLLDAFPKAPVYLVGGTVRDLLLKRDNVGDLDLVVAHVPVIDLESFLSSLGKVNFVGKSFGVFKFLLQGSQAELPAIDIALPRTDHAMMTGGYKDVTVQSDPFLPIEEDLSRRDFTVNALALNLASGELVDVFHGVDDLSARRIRCVGEPAIRFSEDYTRMLRAVRFSCQLNFEIDGPTAQTITAFAKHIKDVAPERIRDELNKILMSDHAERGIILLHELGLLHYIMPELELGVGVTQNKNHIYTVFVHSLKSLATAVERQYSLALRLGALFHDVGKPLTKKGDGYFCTFYNHAAVGARLTQKIMRRLKYQNELIESVTHLVRHHMFYYSIGEVTDAGVRRLLVRLGPENIGSFIQLRICDRIGMGRPKAKPYKLLELERRLQEVQMDPLSTKMLAIDGNEIMNLLHIEPGPRVGLLLKALLNEVLEDPKQNTTEYLSQRAVALNQLADDQLRLLAPNIQYYEDERRAEFLRGYKEID